MENIINIDDKQLILKIQQGHQKSFEILYKKYAPRILRFVNGMVRSSHFAEEIVQDTFIKLYTTINNYKSNDAKFSAYLYRIAYNTALNSLRSKKREREFIKKLQIDFNPPKSYSDPYNQFEKKEITKFINNIITSLPLIEERVFIMKTENKMNYKEIAEILNISRRTAIRKMNSAIKKLHKKMQKSKIILK